jgi:hypothetical protein
VQFSAKLLDPQNLKIDNQDMKITVEFSDSEMKEIRKATGERKKGPAVRKMVLDALTTRRRREFVDKVLSGEFSMEFEGFEAARKADRERSRRMAKELEG